MNRATTPKYRLELTCVDFVAKKRVTHSFCWSVKDDGAATFDNIKKWIDGMNASFNTHNSHLVRLHSMYSNGYLVEQKTGMTVEEYIAPTFDHSTLFF